MNSAPPIQGAKDFVIQNVLLPARASKSKKIRGIAGHGLRWVNPMERIGDLNAYLVRCIDASFGKKAEELLQNANLQTYSQIYPAFVRQYGRWFDDKTLISDFEIGQQYTASKLLIFADRYETRSGSFHLIGQMGRHSAVMLKINVGGKGGNEWMDRGTRLKCYIKSHTHRKRLKFDEGYKVNRAILEYPDVPVCVFVRHAETELFEYFGPFSCIEVRPDTDGKKWFDLVRREAGKAPLSLESIEQRLARDIAGATKDTPEQRKARLAAAPKMPRVVTVTAKVYVRNPDVIVEVLARAAGVCECCGKPAPFARSSGGTPYLEVHHKVPLGADGEDTVENAVAVCPNCHRNEHYGSPKLPRDLSVPGAGDGRAKHHMTRLTPASTTGQPG